MTVREYVKRRLVDVLNGKLLGAESGRPDLATKTGWLNMRRSYCLGDERGRPALATVG
jgi:hypothetical protein